MRPLPPRLYHVARLYAAGLSPATIAARLGIAGRSAQMAVRRARHRAGVRSREELAAVLPAIAPDARRCTGARVLVRKTPRAWMLTQDTVCAVVATRGDVLCVRLPDGSPYWTRWDRCEVLNGR